jgi:ribose 5-phosphate isomerase A
MPKTLSEADLAKRAAAARALDYVEDGMRLGLGTGSTADWFTRLLGERVRGGGLGKLVCVPTSIRTGELAEAARIRLTTLDEAGWLDLTVDGADEIDGALNLIKGGGGALLQEKIVATASDRMVVIADPSKRVGTLGVFPLPIEIVPFGWETTRAIVEAELKAADVDGRETSLRLHKDAPFITDGGHMILDLRLGRIGDPAGLHAALIAIPGVIDTGLFCGVADVAIIGRPDGGVDVIEATVDA